MRKCFSVVVSERDIETTRKIVEENFGGRVPEEAIGRLISLLQDKVSYHASVNVVKKVLVERLKMELIV